MASTHMSVDKKQSDEEIRIVLVGKTGVGKRATANTILRREAFKSDFSCSSVTSECEKARGEVQGQRLAIIDTPGLFDTTLPQEEMLIKVSKCISFSAPGPHVFLIVLSLGRFTKEEQDMVRLLQETFGEGSAKYTIALFTHKEDLEGKSLEQFVSQNQALNAFVQKCSGGYHAFNNEDENVSQVMELLHKINRMVTRNGGSHYTEEMFQEAERVMEKENKIILKAAEEQNCKEREARLAEEEEKRKAQKLAEDEQKRIKAEKERRIREEQERQAREEAERKSCCENCLSCLNCLNSLCEIVLPLLDAFS